MNDLTSKERVYDPQGRVWSEKYRRWIDEVDLDEIERLLAKRCVCDNGACSKCSTAPVTEIVGKPSSAVDTSHGGSARAVTEQCDHSIINQMETNGGEYIRRWCHKCSKTMPLSAAPEPAATRKPDKFDLAFEIMRQLEAEDMETMQSCQFGYVMRVTRERASSPPSSVDIAIARNCLGNLYAAVQRFGPIDADIQFAMREAAQFLGPPYTSETKSEPCCCEGRKLVGVRMPDGSMEDRPCPFCTSDETSEGIDLLAALKERLAVPKGHFCRGIVDRLICHNCGRHYNAHAFTDEETRCPESEK